VFGLVCELGSGSGYLSGWYSEFALGCALVFGSEFAMVSRLGFGLVFLLESALGSGLGIVSEFA
jgi:hypothetical protein